MTKSEIFTQLFSYGWPSEEKLVEYALLRHGFGGDDGYYGVTYPTDLDEYQRDGEGECILEGCIEIHYWDGKQKDLHITEQEYIAALKEHLINVDCEHLSEKLPPV